MMDLIDSILSMSMDIYRPQILQNQNSGSIQKEWIYYKTVDCHAKGVISNSSTGRSGDVQSYDTRYINQQIIQVRTLEKINARDKITNIKNSDGDCIWVELNFPTETPTVFEVIGTTPLRDPFGSILGYNSMLKRSENQKIGI